jgi:hypothetical protein
MTNKKIYEYVAYNNAKIPIVWGKDYDKRKARYNCIMELHDYMRLHEYTKKDLKKFKIIETTDWSLDQLYNQ